MKRFNFLILGMAALYVIFALLLLRSYGFGNVQNDMEYKVEINDLLERAGQGESLSTLSLEDCSYVKNICFLAARDLKDPEKVQDFFRDQNGKYSVIKPLFAQNEWKGYLRFDYILQKNKAELLWLEGGLFVLFLMMELLLLYIKKRVIQPFLKLEDMPYELAKGRLQIQVPETKERYLGKFLWGISMLQETLKDTRQRELSLQREKKTLLLAISHDIKIPLSAIKLYARSIYEKVADDEESQISCGHKIEQHADEIEDFVQKIMEAASNEVLAIEVKNGEFYLKDYVNRIRSQYQEKCDTRMVTFKIGNYVNHILKGDFSRSLEAMENIMENALKYGDGRRIEISFYEEEYCQIIEVFNTGEKISEKEIPHLFDSFFRGSNTRGQDGNGLGLYICKQIMMKMGGDIFVKTSEEGMSFCLVFAQ